MISTKTQPSQPTSVAGPKSSSSNVKTMVNPTPSQDKIRDRAYQLYESRGREPGQDEQDWFLAEEEILKRAR